MKMLIAVQHAAKRSDGPDPTELLICVRMHEITSRAKYANSRLHGQLDTFFRETGNA
jgi:hypothetical protein